VQKTRNPKNESREARDETISIFKYQWFKKGFSCFGFEILIIEICFEFRISDLDITPIYPINY